MKIVQLGDALYTITPALRRGMQAHSGGIPYHFNPYREGSQRYEDWNEGHANYDDLKKALEGMHDG